MTREILSVTRRQGAACIRLRDGEEVRFPARMLSIYPLRAGQMLDTEALDAFLREHAPAYALERAVKMQATRDHTEKEIADALEKSAYPPYAVAYALSLMTRAQWVSDRRFAENFTRTRSVRYGKSRLRSEMRRKGVSDGDADAALSALSEEDEFAAALSAAQRLRRQHKDDGHTLQALLRRGFPFGLCRRAVEATRLPPEETDEP